MLQNGVPKAERFKALRDIAQYQIRVLTEAENIRKLRDGGEDK